MRRLVDKGLHPMYPHFLSLYIGGKMGSRVLITRSSCVMDLVDNWPHGDSSLVTFKYSTDDEEGTVRAITMENVDWQDIGEPSTITVTVEPGDKLNGD